MVCRNTIIIITISLFILINYNLFASTVIEGRVLLKLTDVNSTTNSLKITREEDDKISWTAETRGREVMGSRPPRCLGRCAPCGGNCKAVQVPWMRLRVSNIEYARGDHSSDYKPITWKCQCGSSLFNP